jgi:cytochrome oxidase Cu insertion factor (SCO1/SenC/PrrC family)
MIRTATLIAALALASAVAHPSFADEVGLEVGETGPTFTLVDQSGAERSLGSLLGRGKLAVVFFRSADW